MELKLVCLTLTLMVASTYAGLYGAPAALTPMTHMAPMVPVMFQFANQNRERAAPEVMTCINRDDDDHSSQIRLSLTSTRRGSRSFRNGFNPMGAAFGGDNDFTDNLNDFADNYNDNFNDFGDFGEFEMDDGFFPMGSRIGRSNVDADRVGEFRVDGTLIPSMSEDKAGTYQVVLTQYGRTSDGCSAAALGPIYNRPRQTNQGFAGVGLGMGYGMQTVHPLGSFSFHKTAVTPFVSPYSPAMYGMGGFWNQGQQQQQQAAPPTGLLANPAIVAGSATIFSAHIDGVSKNDLLGRGIALCQGVSNGQCQGYIPFCCTISRDSLSAMELFVDSEGELIDTEHGDQFPINFSNQGTAGMNSAGMNMNPAVSGGMSAPQSGGLF